MTTPETAVPAPNRSAWRRFVHGWDRYWFADISPMRLRVFSVFLFATILVHLRFDQWVLGHSRVPESFWQPVWLARTLRLPPPSPTTIAIVLAVILLGCVAGIVSAATGRLGRTTSAVVFVSYTVWLLWAFSYSKVDHDRLTIVVALFALALTPREGTYARMWNGWAVRLVQVTFLLAYPLSAVAKLQKAGVEWMQSATFARAILRRGTFLGDLLLEPSWLLVLAQWSFVAFEIFAIVLVLPRGRLRALAIFGVIMLHTVTYATIGIHFLPHTICLLVFFPLERLPSALRRRFRPGPRPEDVPA